MGLITITASTTQLARRIDELTVDVTVVTIIWLVVGVLATSYGARLTTNAWRQL